MVSSTTIKPAGATDAPLKIIRHINVCVLVCLTTKGEGAKLKLFIVFAVAKRESKSLHKEFKIQCSVSSSTNGWMNEGLTMR